ncbi:MAG TPA: type II secretion system minor pseudopilin GspK [Burkholderiaceae bacterium]|jgi:general secretion pathway protein K
MIVRKPILQRQRGVAVITALLLTTLAITIVASLFWQQQVQVRSIENQRMQLQKQWILRGALDWARVILWEDQKNSPGVDNLTEDWAVPLADTPLDQYVENGHEDTDASEASLSGLIVDASSRYNLRNLSANGVVNPVEVAAFQRLLINLQLNPALAKAVADAMAAVDPVAPAFPTGASQQTANNATPSTKKMMDIVQVDDLLSVPGFTPNILAKLKDFVIVLPRRGATATQVNANTATAEVLAAKITGLSLSDARALIVTRNHVPFRDPAGVALVINNPKITASSLANDGISVASDYFLVNGKVSLSRASLSVQALMFRNVMSYPAIIWIKEN